MARRSGPEGPKVQFGARVSSGLVAYVMQYATPDGRQKSDAARYLVEAGAHKLRELGSFGALVAWLKRQPPIDLPGHHSSSRAPNDLAQVINEESARYGRAARKKSSDDHEAGDDRKARTGRDVPARHGRRN